MSSIFEYMPLLNHENGMFDDGNKTKPGLVAMQWFCLSGTHVASFVDQLSVMQSIHS